MISADILPWFSGLPLSGAWQRFTLEMVSIRHSGSRKAKYRILLLPRSPSGALFVLIHNCILLFCSILFPSDKLHDVKLVTLGLSLQKVVLQTLEFCRTRRGARQLELFSVQGIILKNPEESAEAALTFSSGSYGCVIQRHGLREEPARILCGASPLGRLLSQRSFSRTRVFLISSGFLRFYLAAFSAFHPQCAFWHEEFDLVVPPMARVLLGIAE